MYEAHIHAIGAALKNRKTETINLRPHVVTDHDGTGLAVIGTDGVVEVNKVGGWVAHPGDQVLTLRVGADVWAVAPITTRTPPPTGIVASVTGGNQATVTLGEPFGAMVMPSVVTVSTGQLVGIVWHRDQEGEWVGHISGVLPFIPGQAPTPPPPPPSDIDRPGGGATITPLRVPASATYTWRQGWRGDTSHLYQGNAGSWSRYPYPQSGFWFYGAGAFDDHKGLACTSARIRVHVIGDAGASSAVRTRFRLHTSTSRPSGYPDLLAGEHEVMLAPGAHTVTLPREWGQDLIDGSAAGVAIVATSAAEYRGIRGLSPTPQVPADPESGHLTITSEAA